MHYRRVFTLGASYFFTVALQDRRSGLLTNKINELRHAFSLAIKNYPFVIDGIVVLPDHMHILMTLPPHDANYSQRLGLIKSAFSRQLESSEKISPSRKSKRERGIWQRRFWEHIIRDELDYCRHMDYIHYNPVKHGYAKTPSEWPYSSLHRYINLGILPRNWGCNDEFTDLAFGE